MKKRKKIVFTNGCFDVLHAGHICALQASKELGDVLIVGLNSDSSVRVLKGPSRPINNEMDRYFVLSALSCVDQVILFNEKTPDKLIRKIKPDVYTKGGDYDKNKLTITKFVESYGGKVVITPLLKGRSSTEIIERCKK